jgi:membrane protease YdiL (CAAX protease family)
MARDSGRLSTLAFRRFGISEPKWLNSVSRNRTTAANSLYLLEATILSVRLSRSTDTRKPPLKSATGRTPRPMLSSPRMTSVRPLTLVGIALALVGPGIIALASNRFADGSESLGVRAIFLLLFLGLVGTIAAIAFRAERLSWSQVGFGRLSWVTPFRAAALVLFFVFVFSPLASIVLAKLGLQSFNVGRSKLAGLPTWYLVVAIVIVATGEEWLYRGYAIERLQAVVGNAWIAGGISLLLFTIAHLPLWGFGVALTTLVSGSILTVLYIRYRDVSFLILAHVLTDIYGLVITPVDRS